MANPNLVSAQKAGDVKTVQAATGALTTSATSTPIHCRAYEYATLVLTITDLVITATGDGIDFYIQTSYDDGTTYTDLENIHFDNTDSTTGTITKIVTLGPVAVTSTTTAYDNEDGSITDDTRASVGLGSRLRIKVVTTDLTTGDFYDYSCTGFFR